MGRPNVGSRETFTRLAGEMFDRGWFSNNGPLLQQFEKRIAEYLGVKHCVAMCNGTIALEIAIRALGLEGEVIVPSYTFIATAHALFWQGITPVFADIDPQTHNLDPDAVRKMITPRTTGIIGVHLWGRAAPVDELQAGGGRIRLEARCSMPRMPSVAATRAALSASSASAKYSASTPRSSSSPFEGGAVVLNDDELAEAMRLMRNFSRELRRRHTSGHERQDDRSMCRDGPGQSRSYRSGGRDKPFQLPEAYREAFPRCRNSPCCPMTRAEHNNYQYIVVELGQRLCSQRAMTW